MNDLREDSRRAILRAFDVTEDELRALDPYYMVALARHRAEVAEFRAALPARLAEAADQASRGLPDGLRLAWDSGPLYDQSPDPLAAVREMAARITRAQAAASVLVTGEPLGFDVPALAGWEVRRAGVDVTFGADDMFRWSTVVPPVGWSAGWVAGPGALDTARALMASTLAGARLPEPQPAVNMLTALPVWESDDAPAGALIPVVVRAVDR